MADELGALLAEAADLPLTLPEVEAMQRGRAAAAFEADARGEKRRREEAGIGDSYAERQPTTAPSVAAGTIIGSGTVSNKGEDGSPGKPISEGGLGYSCLAEIRMVEKIQGGEFKTGFLKYGDRVKIEMLDAAGASICVAISASLKLIAWWSTIGLPKVSRVCA